MWKQERWRSEATTSYGWLVKWKKSLIIDTSFCLKPEKHLKHLKNGLSIRKLEISVQTLFDTPTKANYWKNKFSTADSPKSFGPLSRSLKVTQWKRAKVTVIYKKGFKLECSNYRPISLLSIPSKVVEHLVYSQLNTHLSTHRLLNEPQWGFRSTEDLILHMTEKWREGKVVGVLFVDFA